MQTSEREVQIAPNAAMTFCWIPPGECQLGAPRSKLDDVYAQMPRHTPQYLVEALFAQSEEARGKFRTNGYWLGKYQVTQAEWQAVMGDTPSSHRPGGLGEHHLKHKNQEHEWSRGSRVALVSAMIAAQDGGKDGVVTDTSRFPVECVSWEDCHRFLERANSRGGMGRAGLTGAYTLPGEDEWEYACRGGLGNRRPFHWGDDLNGWQANCDGTYPTGTSTAGPNLLRPRPVGSYAAAFPHPWGLCDMHGNVWELCRNGPEPGQCYAKGGSYFTSGGACSADNRVVYGQFQRLSEVGFRVMFR